MRKMRTSLLHQSIPRSARIGHALLLTLTTPLRITLQHRRRRSRCRDARAVTNCGTRDRRTVQRYWRSESASYE
jgi:hypothetical protein